MLTPNLDRGVAQTESWQNHPQQPAPPTGSVPASDNLAAHPTPNNPLALTLCHVIEQHQNRGQVERLKRELQASEARFHNLMVKNTNGMVIIDRQGTVRFANPAAQVLFNRTSVELVGEQFFNRLVAIGESSEIATEFLAHLPASSTVEIHRKGETASHPVYQAHLCVVETEWEGQIAYLATLRDMTEHQQTQQALQQSNALLKAHQEASAEGILVVGANSKILSYNTRFSQMWQIPEATLAAGESQLLYNDLFNCLEEPAEFIAKLEYLDAHPEQMSQDEIRLKDGRIFERYSTPAMIADGTFAGRIWYFRDLSNAIPAAHLQPGEQLFRTLFEKAAVGIAIADLKDGRILNSNLALQQMLGYSASELHSMTFTDFTHPDDRAADLALHQEMVAGKREHFQLEKRYIHKNGQEIWSRLSASLAHDQAGKPQFSIGVIENITEHKQALDALQRSEARFQKLATNLPGAIYQFLLRSDGSMAFPYISAGCLELCGLTPEQIQQNAQALIDLSHPEDRQRFEASVMLSAQTLQPWHWEGRLLVGDSYKWIQAASRPERTATGDIVWDGLLMDITARKQAEALLRQQTQQLERTLQQLKATQSQLIQTEKMSSLGQMIAGIAHELNNPVSFIYGNVAYANDYIQDLLELVSRYQEREQARRLLGEEDEIAPYAEAINLDFLQEDLPKLLSSLKVGAERIRDLVISLRNFSRLDEAQMKPVNIHEGIDSTLLILQNRLRAKGSQPEIQVVKEYGELPLVLCHAGQLNQVFMNILSNAIDALEENIELENPASPPPTIHIQTTLRSQSSKLLSEALPPTQELSQTEESSKLNHQHSRPKLKTHEHSVVICIMDNGAGIPFELQSKLFDPFFTTKPVGKGIGLGLSIAYQIIVDKHGGVLECYSQPGQGTKFFIEIPIAMPARSSM